MGSKIFHRCFEVDGVGVLPQANPSRPPRGEKFSFLLYPYRPAPHPSAGRADPFVPGGRLTAYRLALTVKGCGYGPGSQMVSPAAPPVKRPLSMLSRRLLLGLPSQLPGYRRILSPDRLYSSSAVPVSSSDRYTSDGCFHKSPALSDSLPVPPSAAKESGIPSYVPNKPAVS